MIFIGETQMEHNTNEFFEKVEQMAKRYNLGVSKKCVGESVATAFMLNIDKARVEIVITAKHCTVVDDQGKQKKFDKSISGWDQRSLEYIHGILKAYDNLRY
jgi:hypothetical protein